MSKKVIKFTEAEKTLFKEILEEFKGKEATITSAKDKDAMWIEIQYLYNGSDAVQTKRTIGQLKSLKKNLTYKRHQSTCNAPEPDSSRRTSNRLKRQLHVKECSCCVSNPLKKPKVPETASNENDSSDGSSVDEDDTDSSPDDSTAQMTRVTMECLKQDLNREIELQKSVTIAEKKLLFNKLDNEISIAICNKAFAEDEARRKCQHFERIGQMKMRLLNESVELNMLKLSSIF